MDTIETAEPIGAEGATSSQDTSVVDAQTVESEDGSAPDSSETVDAEKLYAGKYKSAEELEKAYLEAQSLVGKASQKANLVNQLEETTGLSSEQIADYISRQKQERVQQQVQANPGMYAYQELQELKQQMALKEEERTLDSFLSSPEGQAYKTHRDKIFEAAMYLPSYQGKSYPEIASELFGAARAQGQKDAYQKIEGKIQSRPTGVSQASPKHKPTVEEMMSMSSEELRNILQ